MTTLKFSARSVLMRVKIAHATVYETYCLVYWNEENEKNKNIKFDS